MTPTKPLKNYIRSARKRAGLTQDDLAYLLGGRGGKLVSRYELFERQPMLPAALACQLALGVPVGELFGGVYQAARHTVQHRAKVMELKLRHQPASRLVERKRQTVRRIIESGDGQALPHSS
ncbi:hypothetical protein HYR69_04115 [Candidatus Sumerlaeota bacterium]|nr:hypothetical protein [Candidatus Sumerlaeota bacterium]